MFIAVLPTKDLYLDVANSYLGSTYDPRTQGNVISTALSYAVASDTYTPEGLNIRDALEVVTGGIGEYNGRKYQQPRNVKEGLFEDFIELTGSNSFFEDAGVDNPEFAKSIIDDGDYFITSVGNDKYQINFNNGMNAIAKDGAAFEFEFDSDGAEAYMIREQAESLAFDREVIQARKDQQGWDDL